MYISSYKFIRAINKIKNNELKKELIKTIEVYSDMMNSKINIKENVLTITYKNIKLKVILTKNGVEYEINKIDKILNKKYIKYKNGYYIKISNTEFFRYGHNLIDKKQTDTFKLYDKKEIEQYRKNTVKKDGFFIDETGKLINLEPKVLGNYKEDSYLFRTENDYVLRRDIKKYSFLSPEERQYKDEETDDFYIRFQKIDKNSNDIPDNGSFYGIDKDVAFKYLKKEVPFEEIVNNFKSKKYKRSTTYWI